MQDAVAWVRGRDAGRDGAVRQRPQRALLTTVGDEELWREVKVQCAGNKRAELTTISHGN